MQTKAKYLDEVQDILNSVVREHATSVEGEYCFDSVFDEGHTRIALKVSKTIDNVDEQTRKELQKICPILRCAPLIVGERTRKRFLEDGVVHTRGNIPAINLETLRQILEEKVLPFIRSQKGGYFVVINGDRLKEAREANRHSRGDIADEIGLSRRTIYEYERGTMNPTIEIALQLEQLLDTQLMEPFNLLQDKSITKQVSTTNKIPEKGSQFAQKILQMLSRLGLDSTLTREAPFDILTELRRHVVLGYLKQQIERLDEDRLLFLAKLADVLNEQPAIIASDISDVESIMGIPVVSLRELARIQTPHEFVLLIRRRRGT